MQAICYWCGEAATTHEHAPAKGIFPAGYRVNLITVPSCEKHNNLFSEIDEKVKFYLQVPETNAVALSSFKDKTLRGLQRATAFREEVIATTVGVRNARGEVRGLMEVPGTLLQPFFEKITRALYFKISGIPSKNCEVRYYSRYYFDSEDAFIITMLEKAFRDISFQEGKSQNKKVFQWRYIDTGTSFVVEMNFYEGVIVYGLMDLR